MAYCDFVIKYTDDQQELLRRILYSVVIKRLKFKKPTIIFLGGGSGEGKSWSSLRLQELLFEIQGLSLKDYIEVTNVYTPIQYPKKLDTLLFNKEYKKANIICMHEAREIIKAKHWQSFLTQAIGDVNAMSRQIKRMCIIIISQFIRDITTDIRYTLNFYITVRRPKGCKPRLYINMMWKDDRDLEKPKLRKRKLSGYLVYPNGRYRRFVPQYFEMSKPDKDIIEIFEKQDFEAKAGIIRNKLDRLLKEMAIGLEDTNKKIQAMVDFYIQTPDNLNLIGKRVKGRWKLKPQFRQMHDLNEFEVKQFHDKLNDAMKDRGMMET